MVATHPRQPKSPRSYEEHLLATLRAIPHAESLDELILARGGSPPSCADFLLNSRRVIVEVKCLHDSREDVIRRTIEQFKRSPLWIPLPRDMDWPDVVRFQPHGTTLQRIITEQVTKHLEDIVRKAQRQIRSTRVVFGLPDAHGLLVVLNNAAPVIDAKVMVARFSALTCQRASGGALRYPAIEGTLLLPLNDFIVRPDGGTDGPCIFGVRPQPPPPALQAAGTTIMEAWAAHWGRSLRTDQSIHTDNDIVKLKFHSHRPTLEV